MGRRFTYNRYTKEYTCPMCGSTNVTVRPSMFMPLITCNDCNYEDHD